MKNKGKINEIKKAKGKMVGSGILALLLAGSLCLAGCGGNGQGEDETAWENAQSEVAQSEETESASAAETSTENAAIESAAIESTVIESNAIESTAVESGQESTSQTEEGSVQAGENIWESVQAAEEAEAVTVEGYTYRPERETRIWYASNGQEACKVILERPVFEGTAPETDAINAFYEEWTADKMEEYEPLADEACDWILSLGEEELIAPYGDEVTVAKVTVRDQVIGIIHESYLYTGGAHGMPGRESHLFSRADGKEVTLQSLTALSEEELNELVRSRFLALVEGDEAGGFFGDAADTLNAKTDFAQFSYLTEDGVVFYTTPYEIAPYAAGYTEVTIPYEELGM